MLVWWLLRALAALTASVGFGVDKDAKRRGIERSVGFIVASAVEKRFRSMDFLCEFLWNFIGFLLDFYGFLWS